MTLRVLGCLLAMAGPTHHFALGIGHHAAEIEKLGRALGIETVVVTPEQK